MQAIVILTLVVPGFVYQVSRQAVAGPDPEQREFGTRVLHAIVSTAAFAGVYALLFGARAAEYVRDPNRALDDVGFLGVTFIGFALVVPWIVARVGYWVASSGWYRIGSNALLTRLHLRRPYDPTPSAWDFAFGKGEAGWVRVQLEDGHWLGGYFGGGSFASSFPNPQEIFVEEGWVINDDGTFTDVMHAPNGMIIKCDKALSVDFLGLATDTEVQANDGQEAS
ncbi:DUF6338 family protein [Pengzhenrongella sicca]|uniref:Uncharacterized protein n=1 Tax=Pengzhenrongella sicca TaxID=2819238 RepID=A0A8A4ZAX0_9MICO|nr:DUF6338 family protein [Pengzhenrongella sicca]QTE28561.1 hypothetical protein J4E96_14475 [Pengzhenrongella sicca]